jgi:thioredoxin reductase (NADPH)
MSEKPRVYQTAVIGGGAAGVMAALRGALNNDEVILFPGTPKMMKKSRAFWVSKIENMPGFFDYKKGIMEPHKKTLEWIGQSDFKEKLIVKERLGIENIERMDNGHFSLTDNKGEKYCAQYVVLATGIMDVQPLINGSISPILPYANVQLADYCIRCDGHHVLGKEVSIIGHTEQAFWVAILLHERYPVKSMTVCTNGEKAPENKDLSALLKKYNIQTITEKITNVTGKAKDNILEGFEFEGHHSLKTDICFISLGMIVYNELAKMLGSSLDDRGFVVTDEKGETDILNFYATGDVRANTKKQIYTAWDCAVDTMDHINAKIRRSRR